MASRLVVAASTSRASIAYPVLRCCGLSLAFLGSFILSDMSRWLVVDANLYPPRFCYRALAWRDLYTRGDTMCNFLSAIVKQDGDIICRPESTDSHEDMIDFAGLVDDGRGAFVRVEFLPGDDLCDVNGYALTVDQRDTPEWWTGDMAARIAESLRDRVRRMIVTEERRILLGGCWIVGDGASVGRVVDSQLRVCGGTIKVVRGGTINDVWDTSVILKDYRMDKENE